MKLSILIPVRADLFNSHFNVRHPVCTMLCDVKREPRYATGQAIKFLENSKQVTTVPQGFKRQAGTAKRYTYNCMVHFFPSIYSWPTLLGPHILKQSTSET